MKIKQINLDAEQLPETILVEMTRAEAVEIATWCGGLSASSSPNHAATSAMYDALIGGMFNRFWDDGVSEARRYGR